MNRQRKVVITVTYNDLGTIVDTKAEELDSSAQPERLTDDDFEIIRIHLNACKERLCNQHRWKEAEEYQRINDRFMAFASAQPEPQWIPCSERQPFAEGGLSDKVLATCGYNDVYDTSIRWIRELYFNGRMWLYPSGGTYDQKVYAWMPLPEPYREGQE